MKLVKVRDLLHIVFWPPSKTLNKYTCYKAMDLFLQLSLINTLQGAMVYAHVQSCAFGRANWICLLTVYYGKTYVEDLATDAVGKFAKLTNSKNRKLLHNVIIARYKICLGKIRKNNTLLPNVLVKSDSMKRYSTLLSSSGRIWWKTTYTVTNEEFIIQVLEQNKQTWYEKQREWQQF